MITFLFLILGSLFYYAVGSYFFGYVAAARGIAHRPFKEMQPTFAGIFWPFYLTFILFNSIGTPFKNLAIKKKEKELEKIKLRIAYEQKVRVELAQAEKELDKEFEQLEQEEVIQESKEMKKMKVFRDLSKSIDQKLFPKSAPIIEIPKRSSRSYKSK